jgi:hypothetical protein
MLPVDQEPGNIAIRSSVRSEQRARSPLCQIGGKGTIKVHLHRIFQRIGVTNRTQLAARSFAAEQTIPPDLKPGGLRKI